MDRIKLKPGIYLRGQVEYDLIDAVNYSTLKEIAKSPLHYRHRLLNPKEQTRAMELGTAGHVTVLEPERVIELYAVYEGTKKRNSTEWKEFEAAADKEGKTALKRSEMNAALGMRAAVYASHLAAPYFDGCDREVTLVWRDAETGILCKGRVDSLRRDNMIADLKTCTDATPRLFASIMARLNYHVQQAFYMDGLSAITGKQAHHRLVAVEQAEPHDVVVYALTDVAVDAGRDSYRRMLLQLQECQKSGQWPGLSGGVELSLDLPAWAMTQGEDDMELMIDGEAVSF